MDQWFFRALKIGQHFLMLAVRKSYYCLCTDFVCQLLRYLHCNHLFRLYVNQKHICHCKGSNCILDPKCSFQFEDVWFYESKLNPAEKMSVTMPA